MELDNQLSKKVYVQLLVETLIKKEAILKKIYEMTHQQEDVLSEEDFQENDFLYLIEEKEKSLLELARIDDGFEQIYSSVQEELRVSGSRYAGEIALLKTKVSCVMDLSMKIQVLEKKNKTKFEVLISAKRKDIKEFRMSNQMVTNYYKSMSQQPAQESFLYDKKN